MHAHSDHEREVTHKRPSSFSVKLKVTQKGLLSRCKCTKSGWIEVIHIFQDTSKMSCSVNYTGFGHDEHCSNKICNSTKTARSLGTHVYGVQWPTKKSVNKTRVSMNRKSVFGNGAALSVSPRDTDLKRKVKMAGKKPTRRTGVCRQTHLGPGGVSHKFLPPFPRNHGQVGEKSGSMWNTPCDRQ